MECGACNLHGCSHATWDVVHTLWLQGIFLGLSLSSRQRQNGSPWSLHMMCNWRLWFFSSVLGPMSGVVVWFFLAVKEWSLAHQNSNSTMDGRDQTLSCEWLRYRRGKKQTFAVPRPFVLVQEDNLVVASFGAIKIPNITVVSLECAVGRDQKVLKCTGRGTSPCSHTSKHKT